MRLGAGLGLDRRLFQHLRGRDRTLSKHLLRWSEIQTVRPGAFLRNLVEERLQLLTDVHILSPWSRGFHGARV
jgi:hypothetical protein